MAAIEYAATGRRKRAIARVKLVAGSGNRTINSRPMDQYFGRATLCMIVEQPMEITGLNDKYDVIAKVRGGGISGQAGAVRLGIARSLLLADESLRKVLKKNGFLTRDSRMVERKKYGRPGARKRFQFSKR